MNEQQIAQLQQRLQELADAYGAREVTAGAVRVWHDALKPYSYPLIQGVLTDWPKTHSKMPVPSDIVEICEKRKPKPEGQGEYVAPRCTAHDCPLTGSSFDKTRGGQPLCWLHSMADPLQWPALTERIRTNMPILLVAGFYAQQYLWIDGDRRKVRREFKRFGHSEMAPFFREEIVDWKGRLKVALYEVIRKGERYYPPDGQMVEDPEAPDEDDENRALHAGWTPQQWLNEHRRISSTPKDPFDWARRLRERERSGGILSLHQARCWREALTRIGEYPDDVDRERDAIRREGDPL
jgi:hypothetical protein